MATKDTSMFEAGFLTIPEAAEFLRLSRAKLYELIRRNEIMSVRMDGSRRVPKRALIEYALACAQAND